MLLSFAETWQVGEWGQHMSSRGLAFGGNRINIGSKDLIPLTEIFSVDQKKQSPGLSQASPEGIGAFSLTRISLPSGGIRGCLSWQNRAGARECLRLVLEVTIELTSTN